MPTGDLLGEDDGAAVVNCGDIEECQQCHDAAPAPHHDEAPREEKHGAVETTSSSCRRRVIIPMTSTRGIVILTLLLGLAVSGAFLVIGLSSAMADEEDRFERSASDLVKKIQNAMEDYVNAASFIHSQCRSGNFTRRQFRQLYEYMNATGLVFQAVQFLPNISHAQRAATEAEALAYYSQHYPHLKDRYRGFVGFVNESSRVLEPMPQRDYYYPVHYTEPLVGNEAAIDLDIAASGSRRAAVLNIMQHGLPVVLNDRIRLVQESTIANHHTNSSYGTVLLHPGVRLSVESDDGLPWPHDLAAIVIRIQDLLRRSTENQVDSSAVYLYDQTDGSSAFRGKPLFWGAVRVTPRKSVLEAMSSSSSSSSSLPVLAEVESLPVVELGEVTGRKLHYQNVSAANKVLTVVIASEDDTFEPKLIFIIIGGFIIFAASVCIAIWVATNVQKIEKMNAMKSQADAEKTRLLLAASEQGAKAERELNDFIAHE
jgi:hypothetical protein